jgi:O-methyltransferase/8-demethyl-8-(2,3-dimethoxy-alpha-L-rhamnosyl)tetracenomycin-C 4'-O-methyltransferase
VHSYYRRKQRRIESTPLWSALAHARALANELENVRVASAYQHGEFQAQLETAVRENARLRDEHSACMQLANARTSADQHRLETALQQNELLAAQNTARQQEWEGSVAVLTQQLQGANAAYAQLAETHAVLNRRFDSVASSVLGKLSLLDDRIRRMDHSAHLGAAARTGGEKYLDLLEAVLTGVASSDPSVSPWAAQGYSPETRMLGRDWPKHALTMIGTVRMRNIRHLLETVLHDAVSGDLVETGVWRGGACLYMRAILAENGVVDRSVWLADSFHGLPEPSAADYPADAGDTHHIYSELAVSADEVRANFAKYGLLDDQVRFLEGWFKDTLPTAPIERIALLRLDGDMYESTWQALEALYHKVSRGGFIIVDDYVLPACAKAVDDWRLSQGCNETLHEVDGAAVYWRKA